MEWSGVEVEVVQIHDGTAIGGAPFLCVRLLTSGAAVKYFLEPHSFPCLGDKSLGIRVKLFPKTGLRF